MKKTFMLLLICFLTIGAQAQLKPRVVILTDIGRPDLEPDDTESLVHLLCYADMLEIEGIITSTGWNGDPYPTESAAYRDSVVEAYAPHGGKLSFNWWMQRGIGKAEVGIQEVCKEQSTLRIKLPDTFHNDEIHIICEVHDNSKYRLPAYRRIILRTK